MSGETTANVDTLVSPPDVEEDPLGRAYIVLRDSHDVLVHQACQDIWRKLLAREVVTDWIRQISQSPHFHQLLHKALPAADVHFLEDVKLVAEASAHIPQALYILGLVNERLEHLNSTKEGVAGRLLASSTQSSVQAGFRMSGANVIPDRLNYSGFVCAGVQNSEGQCISGTQELPGATTPLSPQNQYRLAVWMQPDQPAGAWADTMLVETGVEEDIVSFSFEVDCSTLHFPYGRKRVRFHRRQKSELIFFDFMTLDLEGEHVAYVHVFQESRLVKSLLIVVKVALSRTPSPEHGSTAS